MDTKTTRPQATRGEGVFDLIKSFANSIFSCFAETDKLAVPSLLLVASFLISGCTSSTAGNRYYDTDPYQEEAEDELITSDNWECTEDCSGHEAGYEWAEENGISSPDGCGGNSDSFIEGCEAYANEQNEEYYEENREDEDDYY